MQPTDELAARPETPRGGQATPRLQVASVPCRRTPSVAHGRAELAIRRECLWSGGLLDAWGLRPVAALSTALNTGAHAPSQSLPSPFASLYLGVDLLGHMVTVCLISLEKPRTFRGGCTVPLPHAGCEGSHCHVFVSAYCSLFEGGCPMAVPSCLVLVLICIQGAEGTVVETTGRGRGQGR